MATLTAELGRFVSQLRFKDLPGRSIDAMHLGITDCVGVVLAGSTEPAVTKISRLYSDHSGLDASPVFPSGRLLTAENAALVNGVAAHVLDYDDHTMYAHSSCVLVSAIFAEGWVTGASGEDALAAYAAGFELWALLHEIEPAHLQDRGFHPTAIFGTLAAAAACARLLNLNPDDATQAIAIATSLAAGIVANHGSMTKALHVGRAAQSGLFAARLARAGYTASPDVLEHRVGFLRAFFASDRPHDRQDWILGTKWRLPEIGVDIKQYPVAYLTHRSIDAMIDLATEPDTADMIERVELRTGPSQLNVMRNPRPTSALEAKFSMPFVLASAVIARRVTFAELTDEFVRRPDVVDLVSRVECLPNNEASSDTPLTTKEEITVRLKSGKKLSAMSMAYPKGSWKRPLTDREFYDKFVICATTQLPLAKAERLYEKLMNLESIARLRDLKELFL